MAPFDCDFLGLSRELRAPDLLPAYLVWGEEAFLRERALDAILERLGREAGTEHAVTRFEGEGDEKASLAEVLADLSTPSLFSPRKIAVVRRADALVDEAADALAAHLARPPDDAHLVLETRSRDRRRKWVKALAAAGGQVACARLYDRPPPWSDAPPWDNPLSAWTAAEAKRAGLSLPQTRAQRVIDRVGPSLHALHEELSKIALYLRASPGAPVEVDDATVDRLLGEYNEYGLFKLTDAAARGRLGEALTVAAALFDQGLARAGRAGVLHDAGAIATVLVERLYARMRELFRARVLLDRGGDARTLVQELGKHRAFASQLAREARRFPKERFPGHLRLLRDTDLRLKTGRGEPRWLVERLLAGLAEGA